MSRQPDITTKMRAILIDWIIDVHKHFKLRSETLFLSVYIIDKYLEAAEVKRSVL
jgi:cyclin B